MKYNVGQLVRIKKNLIADKDYNGCRFDIAMRCYEGCLAVITYAGESFSFEDRYQIDIDPLCWWWSNDMLENAAQDEFMSFLKEILWDLK